jgi:hypothetical protein
MFFDEYKVGGVGGDHDHVGPARRHCDQDIVHDLTAVRRTDAIPPQPRQHPPGFPETRVIRSQNPGGLLNGFRKFASAFSWSAARQPAKNSRATMELMKRSGR